jgi:hypothetical protein
LDGCVDRLRHLNSSHSAQTGLAKPKKNFGIQGQKNAFFSLAVPNCGIAWMPHLAELIIRTARFKNAQGLPAILLAVSLVLRPFVVLAVFWLCPPDTWPSLMDIIPKLLAALR